MIKKQIHNSRGVTLMELLIVIAIIGIMAGIGLPNFMRIIEDHRLTASNNELLGKLRYIRSLAISRGRRLQLSMSPENKTFVVMKMTHIEYDVLHEDFLEQITDPDQTEDKLKKALALFTEEDEGAENRLHLAPRWDESGNPIYDIPISYGSTMGRKNRRDGVETVTTDPDNLTVIFNPSGTLDISGGVTGTIILQGGYNSYQITVYKGGQIRSQKL